MVLVEAGTLVRSARLPRGWRVLVAVLVAVVVGSSVGVTPVGASGPALVSIGEVAAPEGDALSPLAQSVSVPITLSAPQSSDTLVTWIVSGGTATAGSDYKAISSPRTTKIKAGKTRGFATVTLYGDTDVEGDETVDLTVTAVSGSPAVVGDPTGSVTIVDDDPGSGPVVSIGEVSAPEGDALSPLAQSVKVPITLSAPQSSDTLVTWIVSGGTATAGSDYKAVPSPRTTKIKAGKTRGFATVTLYGDTNVEADETVDLTVTAVSGSGASLGDPDGTVTIVDDDGTVTGGNLWAWGYNGSGQLGLGDNLDRDTPTPVGTDTDWASVAAGWAHTVAVKADGTLWAWGWNSAGQLGLGDNLDRDTPTQVGTDTDWASVTAGYYHTVAVKTTGGGGS